MPKNNKSRSGKSQPSATKKLAAQSRKQANQQLTDQWRLLRRLGVYKTKELPAEKRLTPSRARAIKKKVAEIQTQGKYKKGRTVRPIVFGERKTRSGKSVIDYHLSPEFEFVRTKYKPSAMEGVRKVGGGYMIEKTRPGSRIKVMKNGDIIETSKGERRTRRRYKGRDLLRLMEDIKNGQYKFKKHDYLEFHAFGSPSVSVSSAADAAAQLGQYIVSMANDMDLYTREKFMRESYVEIVKFIVD